MKRFYIYGLFYEDEKENQVCFYIGKGSGRRHKEHFWKSRIEKEKSTKTRKIKQLRKEGKNLSSKILVDKLNEKTAYKLERELLKKDEIYDNVTNESIGSIYHQNEKTRKKISETLLKNHPLRGVTGEDHPLYGTTISEKQKKEISKSLQGENHHNNKLTEAEAAEVKWLARNGDIEQQRVAKIYGISKQSVTSIKKGRTWKHIEPQPIKASELL